jgi:hypothetical protein
MRPGKNAELVIRDTLFLYGEVLALGRDWVELESQMGKVRVKASPERLSELEEGQVVGLRVLARRRGRWEVLGRPELIEVLPYRGTGPREALEGLAALTRRETWASFRWAAWA